MLETTHCKQDLLRFTTRNDSIANKPMTLSAQRLLPLRPLCVSRLPVWTCPRIIGTLYMLRDKPCPLRSTRSRG